MRLNKGGLIVCALYTVHFWIFFYWALLADFRGAGVLSAIAVFPAGLLLSGLTELMGGTEFPFPIESWLNSTAAYFIESLAISYMVGWALSALTMMPIMPDDRSGNK